MTALTAPPTGTVTFLFTDIEGSTKLWEQNADAMRPALTRHDILLRDAIETNGGYVFKTVGDAFCAAFPTANQALEAALAAQGALAAEAWTLPLAVRMALHTGATEERGGDYFGQPLNRVARLMAAGHGGQTLLSDVTQGLVRDALPPNASLLDLGERRLKDLGRPEQVFQLQHPSLPADFPPLRSLDNPDLPNNLPQQTTSFIGREKQVEEVKALLAKTRLLTLTGAGGSGKTRLSMQVAADLLDGEGDGVWLVELASLSDPALVPQAVADVLGVREEAGKPIQRTLVDWLRPKRLLLVLDNCEHLVAACASLATDLLRSCPQVHILASSREPLNVAGEQAYRVPSLTLPDPKKAQTVESLSQFEAVLLFIERAQAVQPSFAVTNANAPAVAQVCFHLDGIPLAIELAAARVRAIPVEEINIRLDNRFRLLTGGARNTLPRQQTLRALIDWSYDLLTAQEKALLCRLSVFAGGWTLSAAEAVCSGEGVEDFEVLDLLTSLVDKSLAVYDEQEDGGGRYRLLETVRQYAAERLAECGEAEAARGQHLMFFAERAIAGHDKRVKEAALDSAWGHSLMPDTDNLRAALDWSVSGGDAERGLRLASALLLFFYFTNLGESFLQARLEEALRQSEANPSGERAWALMRAGFQLRQPGKRDEAVSYLEQSVAMYRQIGDDWGTGSALQNMGQVLIFFGETERARVVVEESLPLLKAADNLSEYGWGLWTHFCIRKKLDWPVREARTRTEASALLEEVLAVFTKERNPGGQGYALRGQAGIAWEWRELELAKSLLERARACFNEAGDLPHIKEVLQSLATISVERGDANGTRAYATECFGLMTDRSEPEDTFILLSFGECLRAVGDHAAARPLFEKGLALAHEQQNAWQAARAAHGLGHVALAEGERGRAGSLIRECLAYVRTYDDPDAIRWALWGLAEVAALGDPIRAARLLGASERLFKERNIQADDAYGVPRTDYARAVKAVRAALPADGFKTAQAEGGAMTLEEAVEYALAEQ